MSGSARAPESPMEVKKTKQSLASPSEAASPPSRRTVRPQRIRSGPQRGVNRNRSGPSRGVSRNSSGPLRGVNRNRSGPLARAVARNNSKSKRSDFVRPDGSFNRSIPKRASSTGSMRYKPRRQRSESEDLSVASTTTMDSVMLAKKRNAGIPRTAEIDGDISVTSSFDNDEVSLNTVDSLGVHEKKWNQGGDDDSFSVFSESFISSTTYNDSDYDEEDQERINVDMGDLNIDDDFEDDEEEVESLKD